MASTQSVAALRDAATAARNAGDFASLSLLAAELTARSEPEAKAWGHYFAGVCRMQESNAHAADEQLARARDIFEELGDSFNHARVLATMAAVAVDLRFDTIEGRRLLDLALPVIAQSDDLHLFAIALGNLGEMLQLEGSYERAVQCFTDAAKLFADLEDHGRAGWQFADSALANILLNRRDRAFEALEAAFDEFDIVPNPRWIAWHLDVCFIVLVRVSQFSAAAKIRVFSDRFRDDVRLPRPKGLLPWFSQAVERVNAALSDDALSAATTEGEALSLEDARRLMTHAQHSVTA